MTFKDAIKSQDSTFWKEAIDKKMGSTMGNNTWILLDPLLGCKPISCK